MKETTDTPAMDKLLGDLDGGQLRAVIENAQARLRTLEAAHKAEGECKVRALAKQYGLAVTIRSRAPARPRRGKPSCPPA